VLRGDDARLAVEHGAAGVIVSNHGGRQLDGEVPSARALPEVAEAVGGEVPVLVDGGIRRGSDVAKALALGARAVLVGRSYVWAHATAGSDGVAHLLELLRRELDATLVILGCPSVDQLDESYLRLPPSWQGAPFQTHGV
jgi:isopentenyl diphosphate isomerase/L-lactate dehydrogenase-like FMN-dependent dehydrogenase